MWGLVNLALAMLMTGRVPQAGDWWHIGLYNIVWWGFCCGLVPGAACIQHFTLRFVLWCSGVMPWRYVRFLDYATMLPTASCCSGSAGVTGFITC
jgi:hypothetical protein